MAKKREWKLRDPEAKSQARRYAHPVPSRTYLLQHLEEQGVPVPFEDLVEAFGLDRQGRRALGARLNAMVRDGQILRNRRAGYCLVDRIALVTGVVSAHRDGFGFVVPDRDGADDVYLSPRHMRELMHGDRVAVRIRGHDRRGRPEGSLVEVLERNTSSVVGKYLRERGVGFVAPENPRITHRPASRSRLRSTLTACRPIGQEPSRRSSGASARRCRPGPSAGARTCGICPW
jgi:ribonuclease R